jgi:hypothetical protein
MSDDSNPKSSFEIAMERLRQRDAERGIVDVPSTPEQKAAIAEVRSLLASRLAELEILFRSTVVGIVEPAERERAEMDYRRELQRLNDDAERKIQKIRGTDS